MKFTRHITAKVFYLAFSALLFLVAGCGSGGGSIADGGVIGTGTIIGTVPGTVIEAYGDQGQYFETFSVNDNTTEHPFVLELPAGVGFYLVMIINEGTENEIVMPIAFPGNMPGEVFARITLQARQTLNIGHIPLYLSCDDVLQFEPDENCSAGTPYVFKHPFILNEDEGSNNPLKQMDADEDGIDDYDDDDHGYGHGGIFKDPQDHDDDRVPNKYDDDYSSSPNDEDKDGIDDDKDENPGNIPKAELDDDDSDEESQLDWNGQSMHPNGQAWREQHGEFAEDNLNSCASCHGNDFRGTAASAQVGCYDCHDGPTPEDDASGEDFQSGWNGQSMHPKGQTWREQHGEFAEDNLNSCASCHGDDFLGTPASNQVGCYGCHNGPDPEDD